MTFFLTFPCFYLKFWSQNLPLNYLGLVEIYLKQKVSVSRGSRVSRELHACESSNREWKRTFPRLCDSHTIAVKTVFRASSVENE